MTDSFPRQHARTRRFTLGRPRSWTITPAGVLFLRSAAGDDPVTDLWLLDHDGSERRLVEAAALTADDDELPPAERARRERAREAATGITSYAVDDAGAVVVFAVAGRLHLLDVATGEVRGAADEHVVFDPRVAPDGQRVAYVTDEGVHLLDEGDRTTPIVTNDGDVRWGVADFVAAEELQRQRGHWWSPDGQRIALCRVDESDVGTWWVGDPSRPSLEPTRHRYPAAGTTNADVGLTVVELDARRQVDARWDRRALPYLVDVVWHDDGRLLLVVMDRAQSHQVLLEVDLATGATHERGRRDDPAWVDVVAGSPRWLADGRIVTVVDDHDLGPGGTRTLAVDGRSVGPAGLQVVRLLDVDVEQGTALVVASDDPTERHLVRVALDGSGAEQLTEGSAVHDGVARNGTTVVTRAPLEGRPSVAVVRDGQRTRLDDHSEEPLVRPRPQLLELGPRGLRAALLLPSTDVDGPLPLLLDPYGGPHAQRVLAAEQAHLTSQWFADQGMAVLVVDGRGTPGRGPAWERAVHRDLAGPVLEDQLDAAAAVVDHDERIDTQRLAVRGWSFGGYLAALAALRRPDAVRAAIAGAPVTDWRLYDTAYTERYLGHPDEHADAYRRSSLVDDRGRLLDVAPVPAGRRPPGMLLIHGLADDNVVAAHALRLSAALLAAGRPHEFLPLSGVTHMTPQEEVAENLLLLQLDFLRRHLDRGGAAGTGRGRTVR